MKYAVGQKLWWTYRPSNQPSSDSYEVIVVKVGIKYVTVEAQAGKTSTGKRTHIFVKQSGREHSYRQQAGRAFLSKEVHAEFVVLNDAWRAMCKLARERLQEHHSVPVDMTMHEISIITGILETLS